MHVFLNSLVKKNLLKEEFRVEHYEKLTKRLMLVHSGKSRI